MGKKSVLIILLSFIFTQHINAQFGLGKAIKNKVDQKKEPEQTEPKKVETTAKPTESQKVETPAKAPEKTPEEIEAELKKISFPDKGMSDPELEKKMIENMTLRPTWFELDDMSQLKALHITSYDWNVAKDKYGSIEAQYVSVCIGFQKNDKCYKKTFFFRKDYLGGGQYQKSFYGYAPNAENYSKQISCETLNAVVAKDKPTTASKPTGTTSTTAKTTTASSTISTSKPATTTTASATTIPANSTVISLSVLGINATMAAPKGTEVFKDGDFRIIRSGNVDIQAEVTTLTLAEMKADVKTNDMYNGTGKILASNLNGFIFSCEEEGEDEKRVHLEFFKTIAGKKYRFIDDRMSEDAYSLADLQPFLDALNTIK
jgi:hypothetical protein